MARRSPRSRRTSTPACRSSALEPSCLATLRSDAAELTGSAAHVLGDVLSLAELLERGSWPPPTSPASRWSPSRTATTRGPRLGRRPALLERAGATVTRVAGCCGLAGNFGMENGHYDVSVAVAETHLLPAVRGPRRTPWCSPTASPAGSSSPTSPASRPCTSPSCWEAVEQGRGCQRRESRAMARRRPEGRLGAFRGAVTKPACGYRGAGAAPWFSRLLAQARR